MFRIIQSVVFLVLVLISFDANAEPVVSVAGRAVAGVQTTDSAEAFLGLRYAEPPTGNLRFRPTVTPEPVWTGTLSAKQYGSACPQVSPALNGTSKYSGNTSSGIKVHFVRDKGAPSLCPG